MFSLGVEMRYWLYSEPTDMRKSFHTLTGLVTNRIGADARNGDVYVFINKRRVDSIDKLNEELSSWDTERNAGQKSINWQFKTADARVKLKYLYPLLNF